jgi:acetyl esterase/lipase
MRGQAGEPGRSPERVARRRTGGGAPGRGGGRRRVRPVAAHAIPDETLGIGRLEHVLTVAGMHPRDVLARAARDPDAVDRYAPGPDRVIDVYRPPGNEAAAVIVLAHGGYWQFDRKPCRLLAGVLVRRRHLPARRPGRRLRPPRVPHRNPANPPRSTSSAASAWPPACWP